MANVILPAPPAQPPLDTPDAGIQLCVGCESFGTIRVIVAAICTAILLPIMLIFVGVNLCPVRAPHSREDQAARSQAPAKARGPQWALRERACMEVSTARGQQKKLHPVSDANISEVQGWLSERMCRSSQRARVSGACQPTDSDLNSGDISSHELSEDGEEEPSRV